MEKIDAVNIEAVQTLNAIISEYLQEFDLSPHPKSPGLPQTPRQKAVENMIAASVIDELNYDTVRSAVNKVVYIMRSIEQDMISSDLSKYFNRRKNVEQIGSILHIGRAYPDKAIKRLRDLRPKMEQNKAA
jgi:hypothetical protein